MFVITCPICGNEVVYSNFEESVSSENCPHCERRKQYEAELAAENFLKDEKMYMKVYSPIFIKEFLTVEKRPAPLLKKYWSVIFMEMKFATFFTKQNNF